MKANYPLGKNRKMMFLYIVVGILLVAMLVSAIFVFFPKKSNDTSDEPILEIGSRIDKRIAGGLSNASVWNGTWPTAASNTIFTSSGTGTEASPYLITSAADLAQLVYNVNKSSTSTYRYAGKYFKLTTNIDLNNQSWVPIGYSSSYYFAGNFDGDGYTISNVIFGASIRQLYTSIETCGLFGYISGTNVIKNLNIDNIDVVFYFLEFMLRYNSALIGYSGSTNLTIENCHIRGNRIHRDNEAKSSLTGSVYTAGLIACYNNSSGNISIINNSLDLNLFISGSFQSSATSTIYCYVGGLAGAITSANAIIEKNSVNVVSGISGGGWGARSVYSYTGGIVGSLVSGEGTATQNEITAPRVQHQSSGSSYTTASYYAYGYCGGLFGYAEGLTFRIDISNNSINIPGVTTQPTAASIYSYVGTEGANARAYSGGIVGYSVWVNISNSIVMSREIQAYAASTVGTRESAYSGGIVGYSTNTTITGCYVLSKVTAKAYNSASGTTVVGWINAYNVTYSNNFRLNTLTSTVTYTNGVVTNTVAELKTMATYTAVGWSTDIWIILPLLNDGYPKLIAMMDNADHFSEYTGDGTEESPFEISTSQELIALAEKYNGLNVQEIFYFKLVADIDLQNISFTPIGHNGTNVFTGHFDGNGHTVSNLRIDSNYLNVGLFGHIAPTGSVKRLGITGNTIVNYDQATYIGGIAGTVAEGGKITDCYFIGSITGYLNTNRARYIDGIAGRSIAGDVTNCYAVWQHNIYKSTADDHTKSETSALKTIYGSLKPSGINADFKSAGFYTSYGFDMTNKWQISGAVNNGYPTLKIGG